MGVGIKSRDSELSVNDQAAAWFARQRLQSWSQSDAAAFAVWLKMDDSHTAAWISYQQLWHRLESVRDNPKVLAIRELARRGCAGNGRLRRSWGVGGALAASLIGAVLIGWMIRPSVTSPDRARPAMQAGRAATAAPILVGDAATRIGERSLLLLSDGSKVTLNTASAIHADLVGRERRVSLVRGEAFFDIAKDPLHPFIVSAGSRDVVAIGTAFNVRVQDSTVTVTLVEGKVRVLHSVIAGATGRVSDHPMPAITLEPDSALIAQSDNVDRVLHLDAIRATSWRTGKLVFEGERLAEVVAEMNRYSLEQLKIADPALNERKISGVFEPTGGAAFGRALEAYGIAHVIHKSPTVVILDPTHTASR